MPDIFLRQGEANSADVKLRDTTIPNATPITGTAGITQAAAVTSASGRAVFLSHAGITQATAILAAAGLERFIGTDASTQAAASFASVGTERFRASGTPAQPAASLVATATERFRGVVAATQAAPAMAETATEDLRGAGAMSQSAASMAAAGSVGESTAVPVPTSSRAARRSVGPAHHWAMDLPLPTPAFVVAGTGQMTAAAPLTSAIGRVTDDALVLALAA